MNAEAEWGKTFVEVHVLPVNAYAIAEVQPVTFKTAAEDEREEVPF